MIIGSITEFGRKDTGIERCVLFTEDSDGGSRSLYQTG
jgi:hypothetical protein